MVATIQIFNMVGEEIYFENVCVNSGSMIERITLQNVIPDGLYVINVIIGEEKWTSQLVIQK